MEVHSLLVFGSPHVCLEGITAGAGDVTELTDEGLGGCRGRGRRSLVLLKLLLVRFAFKMSLIGLQKGSKVGKASAS